MNGEPLAQVDVSGNVTYIHTDHLGTPRYASNSSGVQVWSWLSDAFGNGAPSGTATLNLRFAGQYWDNESGLHYNWNRYYDPTTGRYITSDPIGLAGGLNTYAYVSANPIMFVDPEGLESDFNGGFDWGEGFTNGCRPGMWGCSSTPATCTYCGEDYNKCVGTVFDRASDGLACGLCRFGSKSSCAECAGRVLKEIGCRAKHCEEGERNHDGGVCNKKSCNK